MNLKKEHPSFISGHARIILRFIFTIYLSCTQLQFCLMTLRKIAFDIIVILTPYQVEIDFIIRLLCN